MKKLFRDFILKLTLLTGCLLVIIFAVRYFFPAVWLPKSTPILFAVFYAVTAVVYYVLMKTGEKRKTAFVNYYTGTIFLKLLVYVVLIALTIITDKEHMAEIVVLSGGLYMVYTFFEVVSVLGYLRRSDPS